MCPTSRHPAAVLVLAVASLAAAMPAGAGFDFADDLIFADGFELGLCADGGGSCTIDADCCSLNCEGGICGSAAGACGVKGDLCEEAGDCCSFNCATTCAGSTANCDPIGEACTGGNTCCSDYCANPVGEACDPGEAGCRCAQAFYCRAQGELCSDDLDCCNSYCDRPGGAIVGHCASVGSCLNAGEPCGNPGISGACCSNACVDTSGVGVATCEFLGGCLPISGICSRGSECCSGSCAANGTTADGRPIMRCTSDTSCLEAGEVCPPVSANCCPAGGGATGCEPAVSGVNRCFGGVPGCVLPGAACTDTSECCAETFPNIQCQPGPGANNVCCLANGQGCAFGEICCSGVCAPDGGGNLVCNPGCVTTGGSCTTSADCCTGCCQGNGAGGLACTTDCAGCTLGQLGESCGATAPCCPGLTCAGAVEFPDLPALAREGRGDRPGNSPAGGLGDEDPRRGTCSISLTCEGA